MTQAACVWSATSKNTAMTKFDMLRQSALKLVEAIEIYCCARNEDARLRDPDIEKSMRVALKKLRQQMDKVK